MAVAPNISRTKEQQLAGVSVSDARAINHPETVKPKVNTSSEYVYNPNAATDKNYEFQPGETISSYNARIADYNRTKTDKPNKDYSDGKVTEINAGGGKKPTGVLTASISTPSSMQKKGPPPAVVTSSAAEKDMANKKIQTDQLHADTTQHQEIINQPQTSPTETGSSAPAPESKGPETLDDQLNSILGDLSENQQTIQSEAGATVNPLAEEQAQLQAEFNKSATAAIKKLNQIASGTYPLSTSEKSLLSSTEDTYRATIAAQQQANEAYTGQMTELMASLGIATSAPTQAIGMIHAAISAGETKVADLNAQMATKIAELTQGFQEQDYKMVNDAWTATSDFMKERITTLKDMQKAVLDAAHQQQQDLKDYAELTLKTMISSAEFTEKQKQSAIDNAFQRMQINETQRHNLATESLEREKVSVNGNGGGNFTATQINSGAANAGVPVEVFKGWSSDTKNVFINGNASGTKKTIDDALKTASVTDVTDAIKEMKLPAEAEQYFIDYATKNDSGDSTFGKRGAAFSDTFADLKNQGYTREEALNEVNSEWSDNGKDTITQADQRLIQSAVDQTYGLSFFGIPDAPLPGTEDNYFGRK